MARSASLQAALLHQTLPAALFAFFPLLNGSLPQQQNPGEVLLRRCAKPRRGPTNQQLHRLSYNPMVLPKPPREAQPQRSRAPHSGTPWPQLGHGDVAAFWPSRPRNGPTNDPYPIYNLSYRF